MPRRPINLQRSENFASLLIKNLKNKSKYNLYEFALHSTNFETLQTLGAIYDIHWVRLAHMK